MKKLLALCLPLVLLANCATTAFAMESPCSGSGESEVTAHLYSTYSISIPATIDANIGTAEVIVTQANLEDGYAINVYISNLNENGGITLTHTNGVDEILCTFQNTELNCAVGGNVPLVSFDYNIFSGTNTASKTFGMELLALSQPGVYSGTMTYYFSCDPCE